jgi:prevent-host-death family protein
VRSGSSGTNPLGTLAGVWHKCYGHGVATRIALRELKNNASSIVRRAEAGEEFEVTVDGRPSARLLPARPQGRRRFVPVADLVASMPEITADTTLLDEIAAEVDPILDDPFERFSTWRTP